MAKKSQAALEFIMTYGIVLLIVGLVLAALGFFGVFNIGIHEKEKCMFYSGLDCLDYGLNNSEVWIIIQNSGGFDISNMTAEIYGDCNATANISLELGSSPVALLNSEQGVYFFECSNIEKGEFDVKIEINFTTTETGARHSKSGRLIMDVR